MGRLRTLLGRVPPGAWFTIAFILFCCAYEYGRVLHLRPLPHHLMRQTDCLGITWNYAFTDANFLEPRMMNLHADENTTGRTAGEFPLLYWIVGMIWRAIGQNEFIYRLIGLLLHFAGSFALFRTVTLILRSPFWGGWVALLFFTSPAVVYFAVSFLPDVPALDLVLIGWYAMARYVRDHQRRRLFIAFFCMGLGALLKMTAGMSLLALAGILLLETVLPSRATARWRVFVHRGPAWGALGVTVMMVYAWYAYAAWFNSQHGDPYTPNSVWPLWAVDADRAMQILASARDLLVYQLFAMPVWQILLASLIIVLWNLSRLPWQVAAFNASLVTGLLLFVILWYQSLDNHDYYYLNPLLVFIALLITALWWLGRASPTVLRTTWLRMGAGVLLLYSLIYGMSGLRMRVHGDSPIGGERFAWLHPATEIKHWDDDGYWNYSSILDIEPYFRSKGITVNDRVLVAPDPTWQASLYLMGRTGWNDYTAHISDSAQVDFFVRHRAADYLFLLDKQWNQRPYMRHYLQHPLGEHRGARIYDLRPLR